MPMTAETHATMDLETLRSSADAACRLMKALSDILASGFGGNASAFAPDTIAIAFVIAALVVEIALAEFGGGGAQREARDVPQRRQHRRSHPALDEQPKAYDDDALAIASE